MDVLELLGVRSDLVTKHRKAVHGLALDSLQREVAEEEEEAELAGDRLLKAREVSYISPEAGRLDATSWIPS